MDQIQGTIDCFEGEYAVITTIEGYTLYWPIKQLDKNTQAGDSLTLTATKNGPKTTTNTETAKQVLNEILTGSD